MANLLIKDTDHRVFLARPNGDIIVCVVVIEHPDRTVVRPIDGRNKIVVFLDSEEQKTFSKVHEAIAWINSKLPKVKKVRPIMEDSITYRKRVREMNEKYAPRLVNCKNCNSPRHPSYSCDYCGGT